MPETVIVNLGPNRVAEGFYKVEDGKVIMTYADGDVVVSELGQTFEHVLREEDNPKAIAAVLTRQVRAAMSGELVPGFNDPMEYPRISVA